MPQLDSAFNYNTPAFSSAHCVPQDYNASSSTSSPILLAQSSSAQHSSILLPSHINSYHFWTGYWTKSDQNLHTCCLAGQPGGVHGPAAQETQAITSASQAKGRICKPDFMVRAERRTWNFEMFHVKPKQACLTNHQTSNFPRKGDERWHHLLMIFCNALKLAIWTLLCCSKFRTQSFEGCIPSNWLQPYATEFVSPL